MPGTRPKTTTKLCLDRANLERPGQTRLDGATQTSFAYVIKVFAAATAASMPQSLSLLSRRMASEHEEDCVRGEGDWSPRGKGSFSAHEPVFAAVQDGFTSVQDGLALWP